MMRSAPAFWEHDGVAARVLTPLGALYHAVGVLRRRLAAPTRVGATVVCVGNATVGGTGKTPVAIDLARRMSERGVDTHMLTRGYGGRYQGPPLCVDPDRHAARDVGDEALLLARAAPTWVSPDRRASARAAVAAGARALVMDDGLQNPYLEKDFSILVVDGAVGFGNGRVVPAGPLRERLGHALARVQAVVVMGRDAAGAARRIGAARPVLAARLTPDEAAFALRGRRVLAFAGIGRPEKAFRTLRDLGAEVIETASFPDHHPYSDEDLAALRARARSLAAGLVTTEKDAARLPAWIREETAVVRVRVEWDDESALDALLSRSLEERPAYAR